MTREQVYKEALQAIIHQHPEGYECRITEIAKQALQGKDECPEPLCEYCSGKGKNPDRSVCSYCNGAGRDLKFRVCDKCNGTGLKTPEHCEIETAIEHFKHNIKTWNKSIEDMGKTKNIEIQNSVKYFKERIKIENTALSALKKLL